MIVKTRWFNLSIYIVLILASKIAIAHTFTASKASVEFLPGGQVNLAVETDLIELAQSQLALSGNKDALIEQVRKLSKIQLYQLLKRSNSNLQQKIILYFDAKSTPLIELSPPSINSVSMMLSQSPNTTDYRIEFSGFATHPKNSKTFAILFPNLLGTINLKLATSTRMLVMSGSASDSFELANPKVSGLAIKTANVLHFVYQGIIHIIPLGFDHILFVLALFLLSKKISLLLWQVSAFTLAHTVSLALGVYGLVNVPSAIVEPIIALSIVYVAIENIFQHSLKSHRLLIVFTFGLLHGLGFAAALKQLSMPEGQWLASLLSFNFGVELGQLLVILSAFVLLGWMRNKSFYQTRITTPLSVAIAAMGAFWFVERVWL